MSEIKQTALQSKSAGDLADLRIKQPKTLLDNPGKLEHALVMCDRLAQADLVPDACKGKPGNILARIEILIGLGVTNWLKNLNNVSVVNGVPDIWGDLLLAVCMSQPSWLDHRIEYCADKTQRWQESVPASLWGCRATVGRKGRRPKSASFSIDQAHAAGLLTKNQSLWAKYPADMLRGKALRRALDEQFADVICGFSDNATTSTPDFYTAQESFDDQLKVMDEEREDPISQEDRDSIMEAFSALGVDRMAVEQIIKKPLEQCSESDIDLLREKFLKLRRREAVIETNGQTPQNLQNGEGNDSPLS